MAYETQANRVADDYMITNASDFSGMEAGDIAKIRGAFFKIFQAIIKDADNYLKTDQGDDVEWQ